MNRKKIFFTVLGCGILAGLTWYLGRIWSPQEIRETLASLGLLAPLAYVGLWVVLPVFFFPVAVLALAGGLLFGLWLGAVYTFLGAVLNCSLMFWVARHMGQQHVRGLIQRRLAATWRTRLQRLEGKEGFLLLVLLRLIPAVPYNLINYAFGLTEMPYGTYLLASALGIIPGTFAFINIGDNLLDLNSPGFWIAIGLLALLLVVTALLGKQLWKEKSQ